MSKSVIKISLLVLALPLLTSCATMSEDECRSADWHLIGFGDGANGYVVSRIASHQKACSKVAVTPDLSAYTKGRNEGLIEYCKPITAYRLALRGSRYSDVCPAELEQEFSQGYRYGQQLYSKSNEINTLKRQLRKEQDEYANIVEMIKHKEKRLVQDHVPKAKRIRLLEQIKELNNIDLPYSDNRIEGLQREIENLRYDFDKLKENNPYTSARY